MLFKNFSLGQGLSGRTWTCAPRLVRPSRTPSVACDPFADQCAVPVPRAESSGFGIDTCTAAAPSGAASCSDVELKAQDSREKAAREALTAAALDAANQITTLQHVLQHEVVPQAAKLKEESQIMRAQLEAIQQLDAAKLQAELAPKTDTG
jgi:hypothetical protein